MTREEAKKFLSIIEAWAKGKIIQYKFGDGWRDANIEPLLGDISKYRVKPEQKYMAFKDKEECWNEMHKHPDFGWVKYKDTGSYVMVSIIYSSTATYPTKVSIDCCEYTFSDAFDNFCFTDGTPFGIKEE